MERHWTPPAWLEVIAWASIGMALAAAAIITYDIVVRRRRQKMAVMNVVYPVSALYGGPLALWFYRRHSHDDVQRSEGSPTWPEVVRGDSHCGAGCVLADILAGWLVFAIGFTIASKALYADYVVSLTFAWLLGIVFQYFAIVPMRDLGVASGIWAAFKADTLSILAFQVGMFGGMFVYQELLFSEPLAKTTASYWMFMQLAMLVGFAAAYPMNWWLLRTGVKERM